MASSVTITTNVEDGVVVQTDVVEGITIAGDVTVGARGPKGDQGDPGPAGTDGIDGTDGIMASVVAGNNIDVDATDPANPIVSVETLTLSDISDVTASATEVNYTDGVTSSIQTQLDGKVDENGAITGATKTKITYDTKGLVTAGADATQDDIGDGTTYKQYSATEKTKLAGIATGATANSSDATLLARANHTGTQTASTISDFSTAADARITAATGVSVQGYDADLATIAGLTPTTDNIIQSKAGAWASRTPAQFKTDLSLTKSDVGLGNVDNTSDVDKPISTATQTALDAKQPLDSDLTTIAGLTATTDNFIVSVSSAWASRTPSQVKTTLSLNNVDNTSDATKNSASATLTNKTLIASSNVTEEITSITSSATPTPTGGSLRNAFDVTALATGATFAAPSGTPVHRNKLWITIKDNGGAQTLAWNSIYVAGGVALPTTTVAGKILNLGFMYNANNSLNKWQLVASSQEA